MTEITIEEKEKISVFMGYEKVIGENKYVLKGTGLCFEFNPELGGADLMKLASKADYAFLMGLFLSQHDHEPQNGYEKRARAWIQDTKNSSVLLKAMLWWIG